MPHRPRLVSAARQRTINVEESSCLKQLCQMPGEGPHLGPCRVRYFLCDYCRHGDIPLAAAPKRVMATDMAVEMLKPSPRGRWEKAAVSSQFWLLFVATLTSTVFREAVGFWGSTALVAVIMGLGSVVLVRKAAPERKERLERDADRGVIECALRYADSHPDSLRGRWLPGFAEIGTGTFKFQPDYIDKGEPEGKVTVFSDVVSHGQIEAPLKRPPELKKNWKIVALGSDKGQLHFATGEPGLKLIEERF